MDFLALVNTGLAVIMLGFIVNLTRNQGKYEGAATTQRKACNGRFERCEEDIRTTMLNGKLIAKAKVEDDLTEQERFLRIESDIDSIKRSRLNDGK